MTSRLLFLAPLVLSTPFLLAQQGNQPPQGSPMQGSSMQGQKRMHRGPGADRPNQERRADEREQMGDERMDLDELGLPEGEFWLNADLVARVGMTPDQVRRIADTYLQGTLKLIQLDANLQMEQAKLEPMLAALPMDTKATLTQIEKIADAKAAIDKADARLAFGLRAVMTPDQLTKLQAGKAHGRMWQHEHMGDRSAEMGDRPMAPQM